MLSLLAHAYLPVLRAQTIGKTPQKQSAPQKRADFLECAGDSASAMVSRVAENQGTVVCSGLVRVTAQIPGPGAVLPLPTSQSLRLSSLQL